MAKMARRGRMPAAVLAAAVMSASHGIGAAPLDDSIRVEISRRVPGWWRVERVTIGKPRGIAAEEPGAASRFEAEARLIAPTFTPELRVGAETLARRVGEPGTVKLLTGEVKVPRGGGIEVTLDASLLDSLGKPETALPGRVVAVDGETGRALVVSISERERARERAADELRAIVSAAETAETKAADTVKAAIDARAKRLTELTDRLNSRDRAERLAAYAEANADPDPTRRSLVSETALKSRDPVLAGAAARDWLTRHKTIPVLLYAVKEEPDSDAVSRNIGPLKLSIGEIDASGGITGTLSAPGYGVTRDGAAGGLLTRTDLSVVTFGCALNLRLTEQRTLDGVYRCQTLPPLAARVVLD